VAKAQQGFIEIGLAICRRIVERHGGSLTAKSVQEQGTTFFLVLPQQQLHSNNCKKLPLRTILRKKPLQKKKKM